MKRSYDNTKYDLKTMRNGLNKLFKKEQKKNGSWAKEFNEKFQAILNASKAKQSDRLESQNDDDSEQPILKKSRSTSTRTVASSFALVVTSVKQEPKFELNEDHLYEDESAEPDSIEEETLKEPKCEEI